jgi:hypothetical protein
MRLGAARHMSGHLVVGLARRLLAATYAGHVLSFGLRVKGRTCGYRIDGPRSPRGPLSPGGPLSPAGPLSP